MRLTIRLKLLLAIGAPYLCLVALALTWDYQSQKRQAVEQARRHLAQVANRGATELNGFFRAAASIAGATADATTARGLPDDEQIFSMLRAILRNNPDLYGACFAFAPQALSPGRERFAPYICRDGDGLRSMDLATAYDYTLPQWEWFSRPFASGQPWWTEPYFDEGAGNAAMVTYSMPVRRPGVGVEEGSIVAIQTIDILLEDLQRRLRLPTDLPGARWIILSRAGAFLSVNDPSLLLNTTIFDLAERLGQPGLRDIGQGMVEGRRGDAIFGDFTDGHRRLVSYEPIPSTGWSFAMHVSEAAVLDPVYTALRLRIAGAATLSLILLAIVLAVAFWIARPIPRLAVAMRDLSGGNLDAEFTGATSRDELGELAAGFNQMVTQLRAHIDHLTRETAARERVEGELRVAREIQESLLPSTFPAFPGRTEFDLYASNVAARSIAGDFFDFELTGPDQLYFVIADVSGKGVPAAMFMAVTRTLLRNVNSVGSPADMLAAVNQVLIPENRRMMFVTLFIGLYDIRSGRIRYANAGHPPPLILGPRGDLRPLGTEEEGGALLGVIDGETWSDGEATLGVGESLVLFTDGVTEAGMGDRPIYGQERLEQMLRASPGLTARELVEVIAADVDTYEQGGRTDDVTLMVLRREQ